MRRIAITSSICLLIFFSSLLLRAEETKTVQAGSISLEIPATWQQLKSTQFRLAQFQIPGDDKKDDCELIVYYFGGGSTGGIKANIDRWTGQFQEKGRSAELSKGKATAGDFYWSEVKGTWKKPDGPPFARKTVNVPDSRVVGVILVGKKGAADDYYFLKLSGKDKAVAKQLPALKKAIGADAASMKPFKLADAPN